MKTSTKLIASLSLVAALTTTSANADLVYGLYLDADYWHTDIEAESDGIKGKLDDKGQLMLNASFEHGVPMIPNARVRYATLNIESDNTKVENSTVDAIAYYEILDNIVSVDVGLGAKMLINGAEGLDNQTLGLAYASAGGNLPFTGLSAKAELAYGLNGDFTTTDAQAEIKYNFLDTMAIDLGAKAGYRMLTISEDKMGDYTFKGPYIGAEVHF